MASRNPFGNPPRPCPPLRGVLWYGQRWRIEDACRAVGIHPNTLANRRKRMSVKEALQPPTKGRTPTARPVTIADLEARIAQLAKRIERIDLRLTDAERNISAMIKLHHGETHRLRERVAALEAQLIARAA